LNGGMSAMFERYNHGGELVESYACLEGAPEVRMTVSADKMGCPITTYCYDGLEYHTYDSRNKLLERKTYGKNTKIKELARYEYENPSAGVEIRREFCHKKKYRGKTVSRTDEQGKVLFTAFFDEKDEPNAKYTYEYDGAFRLMRTTEWGVISRRSRRPSPMQYLGLIYSDNRYEYDPNGNLVKMLRFGVDETIDWRQSKFYKYDDGNRKTEEFGVDEYGKVTWKLTFDYEPSGNLIARNYIDANGNTAHSSIWRYDAKGLVTELVIEDRGESLRNRYVYSYEYNSSPS
jgi:hypothetical protein